MKPGYKTVGFYLGSLATAVAILLGFDIVDGGTGEKIAATTTSTLGALGYTAWRLNIKKGAAGKPAWKTTELWLSVAAFLVGVAYASGLFVAGGPADRALGFVAMLLSVAGYSYAKPPKAA